MVIVFDQSMGRMELHWTTRLCLIHYLLEELDMQVELAPSELNCLATKNSSKRLTRLVDLPCVKNSYWTPLIAWTRVRLRTHCFKQLLEFTLSRRASIGTCQQRPLLSELSSWTASLIWLDLELMHQKLAVFTQKEKLGWALRRSFCGCPSSSKGSQRDTSASQSLRFRSSLRVASVPHALRVLLSEQIKLGNFRLRARMQTTSCLAT